MSSNHTTTTQEGNVAGGHIAGRDVNINHDVPRGRIRQLVEQIRNESLPDDALSEIVDVLKHYVDRNEGDGRNLEQKLSESGRESAVQDGLVLKQLFAKRLYTHALSKSAQDLLAHVLGLVHLEFERHIQPLISADSSIDAVDIATLNQVIAPIVEILDVEGVDMTPQDVRGMVYYLAGNCHISWD